MEVEAGVLLEAEEQAHLITVPCVLKCGLAVWTGKKVRWQGPGWYRLLDGVPTKVASEEPMRPTLAEFGGPQCVTCLYGKQPKRGPILPCKVDEQTQKRSDRIDMVYLSGRLADDTQVWLGLLPEEIRLLQEDGPDPFIWSEDTACPHLCMFAYDGVCCIESCKAGR